MYMNINNLHKTGIFIKLLLIIIGLYTLYINKYYLIFLKINIAFMLLYCLIHRKYSCILIGIYLIYTTSNIKNTNFFYEWLFLYTIWDIYMIWGTKPIVNLIGLLHNIIPIIFLLFTTNPNFITWGWARCICLLLSYPFYFYYQDSTTIQKSINSI